MMSTGYIRVFYDPLSAIAVSTAVNVGGKLVSGFAAGQDDDERALFADTNAVLEREQRRQELEDFDKEQSRLEARANAVFAAQGADLSSGSALSVRQGIASEGAIGRTRLRFQSTLRETGFRQRAENFRRRARVARFGALLGGAGAGARGIQSFLRVTNTQARTT